MPGYRFSCEGKKKRERRQSGPKVVLKTHLFDENIIIRVVNIETVVIFTPGVGDVAPVITAAAI